MDELDAIRKKKLEELQKQQMEGREDKSSRMLNFIRTGD